MASQRSQSCLSKARVAEKYRKAARIMSRMWRALSALLKLKAMMRRPAGMYGIVGGDAGNGDYRRGTGAKKTWRLM